MTDKSKQSFHTYYAATTTTTSTTTSAVCDPPVVMRRTLEIALWQQIQKPMVWANHLNPFMPIVVKGGILIQAKAYLGKDLDGKSFCYERK